MPALEKRMPRQGQALGQGPRPGSPYCSWAIIFTRTQDSLPRNSEMLLHKESTQVALAES
jgi:hypothetical protein